MINSAGQTALARTIGSLCFTPAQKFPEQHFALLLRQIGSDRSAIPQECAELAAGDLLLGHFRAQALERLVGRNQARPSRHCRSQIHVLPFWMARRLAELVELGEERVDETLDPLQLKMPTRAAKKEGEPAAAGRPNRFNEQCLLAAQEFAKGPLTQTALRRALNTSSDTAGELIAALAQDGVIEPCKIGIWDGYRLLQSGSGTSGTE